MSIDPVCNMEVDELKAEDKSQHEGETFYFCSPQCKDQFDRNPEQYATAA